MTDKTRCPGSSDISALRRIWTSAFGVGDDEDFFSFYFKPELCVTADHEGVPAAAGYLVPFGNLICGGESVPCAMIYAVAVLPGQRNRGLGTHIVNDLVRLAQSAGYPAVVLCPSEDSLFDYYKARSALRDWFFVSERHFRVIERTDTTPLLSRVSPYEYSCLRERLLQQIPHIAINTDALKYQEKLCAPYGGGLYSISAPGISACAIVEKQPDGSVSVKELLTRDVSEQAAVASIAAEFPAQDYIVRTPALIGRQAAKLLDCTDEADATAQRTAEYCTEPEFAEMQPDRSVRRFGMLTVTSAAPGHTQIPLSSEPSTYAPWYGPAFD